LDQHCECILLHTGQNYAPELSEIFFRELGIRLPDSHLAITAPRFGEQVGQIVDRCDEALEQFRPDRVLILGDTNSGLASLAAARRGIPVYHLEAGNRAFDDRVPEEVNRRVIDHCSTVLMPYTNRSKENLLREGVERDRIFVVGNPIFEVLTTFQSEILASRIHEALGLEPKGYVLVTIHRAENVDDSDRLQRIAEALELLAHELEMPVVVSLHPRTADRMRQARISVQTGRVRMLTPLGFFDFVRLEREAACVVTDSGTVQEECAINRVPNVTVRDVTERPETIEVGSNILSGTDPKHVLTAVKIARSLGTTWTPPPEYVVAKPSLAIVKIVLGRLSVRQQSR